MTGVAIQITLDDRPVRDMLSRLATFPDRLHPALDAIGNAMVASTALRFQAQQGPEGVLWAPSLRVKKHGGQTLILSGRLWHSITHNVVGPMVEWGTNIVYAAIQQLGGTIHREAHSHTIYRKAGKEGIEPGFVKKKRSNFAQDVTVAAFDINIPARPFIGFDTGDQAEALDILSRALAAEIGFRL